MMNILENSQKIGSAMNTISPMLEATSAKPPSPSRGIKPFLELRGISKRFGSIRPYVA